VLKKFAYEAYPAWLVDHPHRVCPKTLGELAPCMNSDSRRDAWGRRSRVRYCG
jgi:hypothetical protein